MPQRPISVPHRRRCPRATGGWFVESLESRRLMAAPTDLEQYMLELTNRARLNPAAEAALDGIDLNEGLAPGTITTDPRQPLAFNTNLIDSALGHSQWMIDNDTFSHTGANGSDPGSRMKGAGYKFTGAWGWAENIVYRSQRPNPPPEIPTIAQEHQDLFIDTGIADRGHRINLENPQLKEVGVGIVAGDFQGFSALMSTEDFAYSTGDSFLTGVAYTDAVTPDNFYTPGEGMGGVTITATRGSDGQAFTTTTWSTGGYTLPLPPGAYLITASGGPLAAPLSLNGVVMTDENIKVDFRPNAALLMYPANAALSPIQSPTSTPAPTPTPDRPLPDSPQTGALSIKGTVFADLNGSGKREHGEYGLAGRQVYLDLNGNGTPDDGEPAATSLLDGSYAFYGLAPGTYHLTLIEGAGWRASTRNEFDVTVGRHTTKAKTFGLTQTVLISGDVFLDASGDGIRQAGESGVGKVRVYVDLNSDGRFEKNEPSTRTDSTGHWSFGRLFAGGYGVRIAPPAGYQLTGPSGGFFAVNLDSAAEMATGLSFSLVR